MLPRFYRNWTGKFYWVWPMWTRLKYILTGNCGYECGMTWFKDLSGNPIQQFVPEAYCPVHDRVKEE